MTDFNYKNYSLEQLENWIRDCISSGEASPHEIYSAIRNAVQEEYNIYKERGQNCLGLLELLSGHRPVNLNDDWEEHYYPEESKWTKEEVLKEKEYYEPSMPPWGHSDLEYMVHNNAKKWILPVEVDGASGEYYLQLPDDLLDSLNWKEGDTLEYVNNGDGTFRVRKITKLIGMDEC